MWAGFYIENEFAKESFDQAGLCPGLMFCIRYSGTGCTACMVLVPSVTIFRSFPRCSYKRLFSVM